MAGKTIELVSGHQDFVADGVGITFNVTNFPDQNDSDFEPMVVLDTQDFQGVVELGSFNNVHLHCRVQNLDGTPPALGSNLTIRYSWSHVRTF